MVMEMVYSVCATSIIRLTTIVHLLRDPDFTCTHPLPHPLPSPISHPHTERKKTIAGNGLAATWSFIESAVAITCACLPPLRPLLVRVFPRLIPSRMRSYHRDRDKESRSNSNNNNNGNKAEEAGVQLPSRPPTISKSRTRKSISKRGGTSRNEDLDFLSVYGAGGTAGLFAPGSTVSTSVWGDAGSVRSAGVDGDGNGNGDGNGGKDGDGGGGERDSGGEGIQIMREVRWDSVSVSESVDGSHHGSHGWGDVEGRLSEGTSGRRSSGAPFLHPQWVGGNIAEW